MEQPYVLPLLYCQCHACWCTGDFRSQAISRHGIDFQSRNIPSLAWEELTHWPLDDFNKFETSNFQTSFNYSGWGIFCETAIRWMSLDPTGDKLTLVQVITWCLQGTSHYLSQCWPRSMSPCGIPRPQWVNMVKWNKMIQSSLLTWWSSWHLMKMRASLFEILFTAFNILVSEFNSLWPSDTLWSQALLSVGSKPLPEPMLTNHQ